MTASNHDAFAELVAPYALGALDASERPAFEAHLATCVVCQRELADLRRVTAGIGLANEAVAPPDALKARVLGKAIAQPQMRGTAPAAAPAASRPGRPITFEWLLTAASIAAAIGLGVYAWSLRSQLRDLSETMAALSDRANTLRNNLDQARRESDRLSHVIAIVQSPATIQVSLTGTKDAPASAGRAYWHRVLGMVVSTEKMPALRPGRAYQLWMVMPNAPAPLSAGVFSVGPNGDASFTATLPPNFVAPQGTTVAVTEEPAGGSPGPTSAILIAGQISGK